MGQISDIIDVTVQRETASPRRPNFGIPMLLGWGPLPTLVTTITEASELLDLGVPALDPLYLAARACLSQEPSPSRLKIGRRSGARPAQIVRLLVDGTVQEGAVVSVRIGGQVASVTLGPSDTSVEATADLITAITALTIPDVAAAAGSGPTAGQIVVTGGANVFYAYDQLVNVAIVADATGAGAALTADIAAIRAQDDDFYLVLHPQSTSVALGTALAAEIEALEKLFLHQTADRDVLDGGATTDIGSVLQDAEYLRTGTLWHHEVGTGAAAAWAGRVLPENPGSLTWAHKTLRGIPTSPRPLLTPTGITTLRAKSVNYYADVAGHSLTFEGWTASGEYLDVMHGSDWLVSELEAGAIAVHANTPKVPYTDAGIDLIRSMALGKADIAIRRGFLAADPAPTFTVPSALEQDPADRADRVLRDAVLQARIAGAIHKTHLRVRLTV
jgi:hypothetical protein